MKKVSLFLFALLALAFTSCLEEQVAVALDQRSELELPDNPVDLSRTDASELVGLKFGMAEIFLTDGARNRNFSMMGCELSVEEAGTATEPAPSRIDESGSTFAFGNTIQADALDAEQNTITFVSLENPSNSGEWSWFLETSVFPIVADAPLKVSREGDNMVIECSNCPFEYEGRTYTDRKVVLSLVD